MPGTCHILCQAQLEMRRMQASLQEHKWATAVVSAVLWDSVDSCHWGRGRDRCSTTGVLNYSLQGQTALPHTPASLCRAAATTFMPVGTSESQALALKAPGSATPGRHWQPSPLTGCEEASGQWELWPGQLTPTQAPPQRARHSTPAPCLSNLLMDSRSVLEVSDSALFSQRGFCEHFHLVFQSSLCPTYWLGRMTTTYNSRFSGGLICFPWYKLLKHQ